MKFGYPKSIVRKLSPVSEKVIKNRAYNKLLTKTIKIPKKLPSTSFTGHGINHFQVYFIYSVKIEFFNNKPLF